MMRTLFLAGALALMALPTFAACPKLDCSKDPQAWADMMGTSRAQRREQQIARDAAEAEVRRRGGSPAAKDLTNLGYDQRLDLIYSIEDTFSRLVGQPYHVLAAVVVQRGADDFLFCGSGFFKSGAGVFVYDTRPGGIKTLQADRQTFAAAGCAGSPSVTLR
jgi:hypothetical protein